MTGPSPPPPDRPLHVSGSLRVELEGVGDALGVTAEGDRIVINLLSTGVLKTLLGGPGDKSQLNQVTAMLQRHDVEIVLQLKGQTIATLGKSADPGAFEKVFNLEGVDVRFRDLAKALFKR